MGVSSSVGRSLHQHLLAEAITVNQRQTFSSWRTLPGQGRRLMVGLGIRVQTLGFHVQFLGGAQQEVLGELGMSSRRSLRAGIWMRMTLRRWNRSS